MDAERVGKRIKLARAYAHLSQPDLASILGVSTSTLGRWEKAQKRPPQGQLIAVVQVCDLREDWFTADDLGFGPPQPRATVAS